MAERAGATITEIEASHVVMVSQPQPVTDVILDALAAAGRTSRPPAAEVLARAVSNGSENST